MKFKKKPVVIDAIQWTGKNEIEITQFINNWGDYHWDNNKLIINTLEGEMIANVGDWIIKGVKGEFYPCKPSIFAQTYEKLTNE